LLLEVLLLERGAQLADLAVERAHFVRQPVDLAALLVGVDQPLLVEAAADARIETAAVFADLIGPIRNAEALEALLAALEPGGAIRGHADLGAGLRMLDQVFLGAAVRAIADADVFPVRGQALVLGDARASAQHRKGDERE